MKTLKSRAIFVCWIVCICNFVYSNQTNNYPDTLIIVTQKQKGYGPFKMAYSLIVDDNYSKSNNPRLTKLKGIPDTLSRKIISTIKFHFKNNMISSVSVAAGYNSKGDLMYVIDADNNMDFSNNILSKARDIKTRNYAPTKEIIESLVPVQFEHYDNKSKVKKDTTWLLIGQPLKHLEGITSLGLNIGEYRRAYLEINGDKIEIFLSNGFLIWDYTNSLTTFLYRDTKNKEYTSIMINEFIIINDKYYKFVSCTQDGSKIVLTKVDADIDEIQGTQVGLKLKDFEVQSDNSHVINLKSVKGKYVLLEFWATWCSGCVKELPLLKDAYKKFSRNDFEIIGIAVDDSAKVEKFVREKRIIWPNSIVSMKNKIVTDFNVTLFPTMILIDRNGKIVAKGQHIDLIKKLGELIKTEE